MFVTNILLGCIVLIEFCNLVIRIIKIIPPEEPELDEEIRRKMYS